MKRFHQALLIGSFLPLWWLGMMAVHELGHVTAALNSGGTVDTVVLHPLTLSRTDVSVNLRPLLVVWAGALVGVLLPLALLTLVQLCKMSCVYFVRFFDGFCLIANGAYIGAGSFQRIGDAGDMLLICRNNPRERPKPLRDRSLCRQLLRAEGVAFSCH